MAQDTLVDREEVGLHLLDELEKAAFPFSALMWVFYPEADQWRLLLATELADKKSTVQEILLTLDKIIDASTNEMPDLADISIVSPNEPIIKAVSRVISVTGRSSVFMSKNSFNGIYVDELIVFRTS